MSRYSPQVLPAGASPFADALSAGFDEFQAQRARKAQQQALNEQTSIQREAAADRHTSTLANLYAMGFRSPDEVAPPDFTAPSSTALVRSLVGPAPTTPTPGTIPTGDDLASALRSNLPPPTASPVETALRTTPSAPAPIGPIQAGGRFDPTTGTFGGGPPSPMALKIGQAVAVRLGGQNWVFQDPRIEAERRQQAAAVETEKRRQEAEQAKETAAQQRDYRTLSAIEPGHVAVKDRPFDPSGHLNYSTLLADALKRQQDRQSASLRVSEHGPATLTHPNTINPLTKKIEDVYSDGTRKIVRDATAEEIRKATYIAPAPTDTYTPFQGTDPTTGKPVVRPFDTKTGQFGPVADVGPKAAAGSQLVGGKPLAAPIAAKVGQFGEMLKKADDLFQKIDALDVGVGQTAARDISEHGVGIAGMHIPGTKGVGSLLMNRSPAYSAYQAALSPFILAAAHALSGARINQDQVEQIRKSVELAPGDFGNKEVREQKFKNLLDLINSIGGSLPSEAIATQEAQMGDEALGRVVARGYKRVAPPSAPGAAPQGATGNIDLSAKPTITKAEYDELRKMFSDAEIRAKKTVAP